MMAFCTVFDSVNSTTRSNGFSCTSSRLPDRRRLITRNAYTTIGRRIFSSNGKPITNISLQIECIDDIPSSMPLLAASNPKLANICPSIVSTAAEGSTLAPQKAQPNPAGACPFVQSLFRSTLVLAGHLVKRFNISYSITFPRPVSMRSL